MVMDPFRLIHIQKATLDQFTKGIHAGGQWFHALNIPQRKQPFHAKLEGLFAFIRENPDIFTGFFHYELQGNVLPNHRMLQEFGFYGAEGKAGVATDTDSCGAHSPKVRMARSEVGAETAEPPAASVLLPSGLL